MSDQPLLPVALTRERWVLVKNAYQAQPFTEWHTFYGAELPALTDFLRGYRESEGPERRDAIMRDALAHQLNWIRSLAQISGYDHTLELRLIYSPVQRRIRMLLLGKVTTDNPHQAAEIARTAARSTIESFPRRQYGQLVPLSAVALEGALALPEGLNIVEFRRHESEQDLGMGSSGYMLAPIEGHPGGLHRLFHGLVQQNQAYIVGICLRPTQLSSDELGMLGRIASVCRDLEAESVDLLQQQIKVSSIPAGLLADLYASYLERLAHHALLLRISLASPGPIAPTLATDLCADLAQPYLAGPQQRQRPNQAGRCIVPRSQQEAQLAYANLRYLELYDWGETLAQPALVRLRQLIDPEAALGPFRIPVPPPGGLPGVDSRPPSQFAELPAMLAHSPAEDATIMLGQVHLPLSYLSRHLLVAGTIGSGKTNTCIQILHQIWAKHRVPFLVIEPVNSMHNDYRSLAHHFPIPDQLRIFTVGDEGTAPLRFNPLVVPDGVILNAHIAGLMQCFRAALPLDGILPTLLEAGLRGAYQANRWQPTDRGGTTRAVTIPTLADLIEQIEWMVERRYSGEVAQNIRGALISRLRGLIEGSAGRTLTASQSIPLAELFERPTILELRQLGSDEDRAMLVGFVLLALQEYSDRNRPVGSGRLNHVVLLEEAHNLMEETKAGDAANANAKAGAVAFFTRMLAENRKYGQGFIIAEQIPTLLAEGAVKNSVTKIMHRLPGRDDIEMMGGAMNFSERHTLRAPALQVQAGEAFFYTEGLDEATLINIPRFAKEDPPDDTVVRSAMLDFQAQYPDAYAVPVPYAECRLCRAQCQYRSEVEYLIYQPRLITRVQEAYRRADPTADVDLALRQVFRPIEAAISGLGFDGSDLPGATFCAFLHLRTQIADLEHIDASFTHQWLERTR